MTHATHNIPDGDSKTPVTVSIENILERTKAQLSMLQSALSLTADIAVESKSPTEGEEVPKELRDKASDSSIRILHQIDNIVEDMQRWGNVTSQIEKSYVKLIGAAAETQEALAIKAKLDTLPHARHDVHLRESEPGLWEAYLVQHGQAVKMGHGPTAQDALTEFDRLFLVGEQEKKAVGPKQKKAVKPKAKKDPQAES